MSFTCCRPSRNTRPTSTSSSARGLSGEAYHGHVFWDEIFVFPYLTCACPTCPGRSCCIAGAASPRHAAAQQAGYRGGDVPLAERSQRA